jgi:hypothetical protein
VSRALWFGLALLASACGGEEDLGPPTATLGSGDTAFEPLDDGDSIFVIQGPQGGFHVLGSVLVSGIEPGDANDLQDPSNPTTAFTVFVGNDRVDADASSYTQGLDPSDSSDGYEMIGRFVILDIMNDSELDSVDIRLAVEVVGTNGNSASDSRLLVAEPHPANQ